jgi:hypothetical protein
MAVLLSLLFKLPLRENLTPNTQLKREFLLAAPVLTSRSFCYGFCAPCTRTILVLLSVPDVKGFIMEE